MRSEITMIKYTLVALFQIILNFQQLSAMTLFRDERLYPAVKDFENNFLSLILTQQVNSVQETKIAEIIYSAMDLTPANNMHEYDKIKLYSANFAFLAAEKLYQKFKPYSNIDPSCKDIKLFRVILQAFKKVDKIIADDSRLSALAYQRSYDKKAPKPLPVFSNRLGRSSDSPRSLTSLFKDKAFVESSDLLSNNHVMNRGLIRTSSEVVIKTIKPSKAHANYDSINKSPIIIIFSNKLQKHLESSKLFSLVFNYNLPMDLAKEYAICFAKSVAGVRELSFLHQSFISNIFTTDGFTGIQNSTTKFYAQMFSSKISKHIKGIYSQINPDFEFLVSSLSKSIMSAFSNIFFHGCAEEKLKTYISMENVKHHELSSNEYFSLNQLEFAFSVTEKLDEFFKDNFSGDKRSVILALKLTLFSLTKTFKISESLFFPEFEKSLTLFKQSSVKVFLTFAVLDITRTLKSLISFYELNNQMKLLQQLASFMVEGFRENFAKIKKRDFDQQNSKRYLNTYRQELSDYFETHIQSPQNLYRFEIYQKKNIYKENPGLPLIFTKQIHQTLLSSKVFEDVHRLLKMYDKPKPVSSFCAIVITYHLSNILELDGVKILKLVDLFVEIFNSDTQIKEIYAQNFAIQLSFWFTSNGLLTQYPTLTYPTFLVDCFLNYVRSCHFLESKERDHGNHYRHKRDAAFSIQIDNETLSPPISSSSPEFKQKLFFPLMDIEVHPNKFLNQSKSVRKETTRVEKVSDSMSLMPLKESFKSLLYYNLMSSSVFKEVMYNSTNNSCEITYTRGIASNLLKYYPWSVLNETVISNALLQDFPFMGDGQETPDFADIFASRISDLAEKYSLIEKNRLNEVATATVNSITSYLTKRLSNDYFKFGDKNKCKSDADSVFTNSVTKEKHLINHTLTKSVKYKGRGEFFNEEPNILPDLENRTDRLSSEFAKILQKNLISSDVFKKAFYDGLPFPVASAYAFSMAKSLSNRSELKAITESEFSIAFETALDLVGTKASMQAYSENFSSEISKLLVRKRLLLESSLTEKADFIANVIVHGLPVEKVSPELKTFSQNLGENNNAEVGYLKKDKEKTIITQSQIDFSKSIRSHLKNCTNFTSTFYTGFSRDKATRYFFEIAEVFESKLSLNQSLISLFNQNFERDIKLLNEYPKTDDYINFMIMKITWLFTSYGIIKEIHPIKLSEVAVDVIKLALYREKQVENYCLDFGMAHEKDNILILGELLCYKLLSSKIFKNSFRNMTPREISAAYAFSMAESLLKGFKSLPESAISVAFVKGMFSVKQNPSTKKYAAAFAFEIAHVFDTYETLSWDKIREYVESISQAMLSGLPADISTKEEKQTNNIIHKEQDNDTLSNLSLRFGKQEENLTSIDILGYQLLTSELFNETFNGSMSFQKSFELSEVISQAVINISESKIVGKLTYSLPYYAAIRNKLSFPPDYAESISKVSIEILKELNDISENEEIQIALKSADVIIKALETRMNDKNSQLNLDYTPNCSVLLSDLKKIGKNSIADKLTTRKFTNICSNTISKLVHYNFMSSKLFKQFFLSIRFDKYNSHTVNILTNCITNSSAFPRIEGRPSPESYINALMVAKHNVTIETFSHSLSNVSTIMELENHISYATGMVSIATRLSNMVLKCISKLRRIDKLHTEIHQTTQHPYKHTIVPQLELEQVDSNSENINVDNDSESIDSFSILNNNSSNDDDSQEILKLLHSNQEVLSLTSNSLQTSLLTYNTKEKHEMKIESMKNEKTIVLFYRFLFYNLRTSRAFQPYLLQDLKQVPTENLALAMSKYIANIPDFSSISEQHSFQVYNMSLNLIRNESDPMKFANQLSLASTNLLLYYDLLETNKLISQAALVSIVINKAIFYVTGKFDDKYNLNASDKTKQITRITQAKNPSLKLETAKFGGSRQDKGSSGSEELLFNEILFSGLSSSRLFSKVFNSNLTLEFTAECFPQLVKQLSKVMKHCFVRRKYMNLYKKILMLTEKKANTIDYVKIFTDFLYQILKFSECIQSEKLPYQAFDMFNALSTGLSRCLVLKERISSKKYILTEANQAAMKFETFLNSFCAYSHHFCQVFNPWISQAHAQFYGRAMANSISKVHAFSAVLQKFLTYTYVKELKKIEAASCSIYAKLFSVHTTNVIKSHLISSRAVFQASVTFAAMDKGIQTTRHRLSEIYSVSLDEVISFNLFWDSFGEVNISLLKNIIYNTPTATTIMKAKESKTLTSTFKKLLTYNLLSSKLFIRSFNNNTTIMRASKYAFAIANSVSDVIKPTSVSMELIQAFDISFFRLQRHTSTGTYASIFSSIISDIFNQKNILTSTKLQPLSINVSYAINSALFSVSSMKRLPRKLLLLERAKKETLIASTKGKDKLKQIQISQHNKQTSLEVSHDMLFEESLKLILLSSDILKKYSQLPSECSESRLHAIKMAEILKGQLKIDMEPFQSLVESYNAVLSSLHKRSDVEQGVLEIASITSGMLKNLNFTDPSEVISQAVLISNKLNLAISASISIQCNNENLKNISSIKTETNEIIPETKIFRNTLHANLESFIEYFLRTSCSNYITIYAEEIAKSLASVVKNIHSTDQYLLIELLKDALSTQKLVVTSDNNLRNISSIIANFLKLKSFIIRNRLITQAVTISHILRKAVFRTIIKAQSNLKSLCVNKPEISAKIVFKESLEHNLLSSKNFMDFFGCDKHVIDLKTCSFELSKALNSTIQMRPDEFSHLQKNLSNILLEIRSMKNRRIFAAAVAIVTTSIYDEKNILIKSRAVQQAALISYVLIEGVQKSSQNCEINTTSYSTHKIFKPLKKQLVSEKTVYVNTTNNFCNDSFKNISTIYRQDYCLGRNDLKQNEVSKETKSMSVEIRFTDSLTYNIISSQMVNKIIEFQSNCQNSTFYTFKIVDSIANLSKVDANSTQILSKTFDEILSLKVDVKYKDQLARKIASVTTEILSKQRLLNTSRLVTQAAFISNIMIKSIANAFEVCSNDGSRVKKVETSILGDETFNKSLFYNLQTQTPLGFFLQNASHNEVTVLIKAMLKFLISALKKTRSQDDNELLHSTLYEMFLKEKAKNHSNVNEAIVSSVITSFLKQKNYLMVGRSVTQAAIIGNALTKGILIAILEPNLFSEDSLNELNSSTETVFQEYLEHNLLSSNIFTNFFHRKKDVSELKNCASEITSSIKSFTNLSLNETELFQNAITDLFLLVKNKKSAKIYAKIISRVVSHLLKKQHIFEKSRIALQAASIASALLKGISRTTKKLPLTKRSYFQESFTKIVSPDIHDHLQEKFHSALQYNMLSSKIFNLLRYTRTWTEIDLYAGEMSKSIAILTNNRELKYKSLQMEFKRILNSVDNKTLESYVRAISFATTIFLTKENFLVSNRLVIDAAVVNSSLRSGIVKAVRKHIEILSSSYSSVAAEMTSYVFPKNEKQKCYLIFREIFHYNLMSFSSCKIAFSSHSNKVTSRSTEFIVDIVTFIAELISIDDTKLILLKDTLKDTLRSFSMKINLNVFLYATSSITAEEFCENREVEFSRLVHETVSYSKILCDRISMMPSKENKKDLNFPNYKSNVVLKNGTWHDLARIELENSLYQSLLSSSLLQTFYLCGCNSRQLSLLAAQLSGAVYSLHKSSMLKQLSLQKKLVRNLSASNNKCEKLNIRALASTMTLFILDENTSKNNNLIFQSSNFSNDFKNAIEKAMTSNNTLPFNSVLFPQRSSKLVNNYCQANAVNNRHVSSEIEKESIRNSMTCELFVTDNANTPQNRYITSLYYNLMSARVFRAAFKPGIPKEIAYNFTTTVAHAVADSAQCSTYNKMTLERFYHNALLFLHPKNETKDFACTIALTTALVCYEPKLERNASLIATFISNAICKSLQIFFLKTSFQPNIMEIT